MSLSLLSQQPGQVRPLCDGVGCDNPAYCEFDVASGGTVRLCLECAKSLTESLREVIAVDDLIAGYGYDVLISHAASWPDLYVAVIHSRHPFRTQERILVRLRQRWEELHPDHAPDHETHETEE